MTTDFHTSSVVNTRERCRFAIVLFDDADPAGTTVHSFSDPELWEWLNRSESFPNGTEEIAVPIPGTDRTAHVTVWDPTTDKAIHLACLPGTGGQPHPALRSMEFGPSDSEWFRELYASLRAEAGAGHVFEGRW